MLNQRLRVLSAVVLTGLAVHLIPDRRLTSIVLLVVWWLLFFPLTTTDYLLFPLAAAFFTIQNYVCLKAGLFAFQSHDFLLMPYYEPLLWGFYFISMKRFVFGDAADYAPLDIRSVVGLVVTSIAFSIFSSAPRPLLVATAGSTLLLVTLFHTTSDLACALFALILGFIVELFGVRTGLWSYLAPDFLGIPFWFATMWLSVGLLGRRFAMPAAAWLGRHVQRL